MNVMDREKRVKGNVKEVTKCSKRWHHKVSWVLDTLQKLLTQQSVSPDI